MKEIDLKTWKRAAQFNWFKTFPNPTYGLTVSIDVTDCLMITKKRNESFFINALYLITKALNNIEGMRLRYDNGKVILFDEINPTYTVATPDGNFVNSKHTYTPDYDLFYKRAKEAIDKAKNSGPMDGYNDDNLAEYYMTCIPWIDVLSMTHPIPAYNLESLSVPRICWDKYITTNGVTTFNLNITLNHMLVDGQELCKAFNEVRKYFKNARTELKFQGE